MQIPNPPSKPVEISLISDDEGEQIREDSLKFLEVQKGEENNHQKPRENLQNKNSSSFPQFEHSSIAFSKGVNEIEGVNGQKGKSMGCQKSRDNLQILLKRGKMIRILKESQNKGQFLVQHCLNGMKCQLMRTKDQILNSSVSLLLDYYENILGIVDDNYSQLD